MQYYLCIKSELQSQYLDKNNKKQILTIAR